jgi:hypothetical protein
MGHRTQQIIFTLLVIGASIVPRPASSQDRGMTVLNQATTPEQVLGVFLLIGWALSPASRCGMGPATFRTTVECQRAKGYTFEVSYPSQCVMTVTERRPPVNVKKKWDGTVTGSYIVARQITFDLHALSEDGIQFEPFTLLRLKMSKALMPSVRILRTGQPETWIRLPDPPLESDYDVKPGDPFDSAARKSFNEAERVWRAKVASYGGGYEEFNSGSGSSGVLSPLSMDSGNLTIGVSNTFYRSESIAAKQKITAALKGILSDCPAGGKS